MKTPAKIVIVLLVAAAAVTAVALKGNKAQQTSTSDKSPPAEASAAAAPSAPLATPVNAKLPKLLDLGATKCIPCKMMAPVLENLKTEYAGRMIVEFIDVWENRDAGKQYNIEAIPTQIFYNAEGKELFRHTGFFGKDDILGEWKKLGVDLAAAEKK
jgi:thioredoxin 1